MDKISPFVVITSWGKEMAHKQIGKSHQSLVGVECYKDKQRLIGNAVEIEILNRVVREAFLEDDI